MTWCDKLASTPSVGIFYDADYASMDAVIDSIRPWLNKWGSAKKPPFRINISDAFKIEVAHDDGFTYSFEPTKTAVTFQHRVKFRHVSGGLPTAELISSPQPFSQLLDRAISDLIEMALQLPHAPKRSVKMVGVVANTFAAEEDVPPGLRKIVHFLGRPWGELTTFGVNLTSTIQRTEDFEDRCIHILTKPEDSDELSQFQFDWQRTLTRPVSVQERYLSDLLSRAREGALGYFEHLAIGNNFDV